MLSLFCALSISLVLALQHHRRLRFPFVNHTFGLAHKYVVRLEFSITSGVLS